MRVCRRFEIFVTGETNINMSLESRACLFSLPEQGFPLGQVHTCTVRISGHLSWQISKAAGQRFSCDLDTVLI